MTNNYSKILDIARLNNYEGKTVILSYIARRHDLGEKTRILGKELVKNVNSINIEEVKRVCDINKCRCYLSFVDSMIEGATKALFSNADTFLTWKDTNIYDISCLHLIDCDDISLESDIISWLEEQGAVNIVVVPSNKNHSIIFKCSLDIMTKYLDTDFNKVNSFHPLANINLYVPDFIENE